MLNKRVPAHSREQSRVSYIGEAREDITTWRSSGVTGAIG